MLRRILMTTDPVGGVWTYSLELCEVLSTCGVQVLLVSMGGKISSAQRNQAARISSVNLLESQFRLEWMTNPWNDVRAAGRWLLELEQKFQPDIIHLNQYCFGSLPFTAPILMAAHSCVSSWWAAVRGTPLPETWKTYKKAVRRGLSGADYVVAPSESMLLALQEHYAVQTQQTVIPNGRSAHLFVPAIKKQEFIFSAGRVWDEAKNIRILADVARRLPWPVVIAGESRGQLHGKNLHFLGKLDEEQMRQWLSRASIFVAPALYEPFGLSVLEAALSECAPILSNIASLRENWFGTAFFVDPADPSSIHYGLHCMIKNPTFRWMLGRKARKRALRYSSRRMTQSYMLLYNDLLVMGRKNSGYGESLAEAK